MVTYAVPDRTIRELDQLVDRIQAAPGRMVDASTFPEKLDTSRVLKELPEGMSEEDFIGIIQLAMLTECATDTYSNEITKRARMADASWLERFNEEIWKPDEYMHAEPFKLILLGLGFSEKELDDHMARVQQETFQHTGGDTPVHVTTFGMIQEYLTDHWYAMIGKLLRTSLPEAARMNYDVKKRETLHMIWYRQMTAMQVGAQPELVESIGFELANFRLPGNSLIPEIQANAERWLRLMSADFSQVARDLARQLYLTVNSPKALGQLVVDAANRQEIGIGVGRIKPRHIRWALERPNGWGYGLLGEAVLERMGLAFMFRAGQTPGAPKGISVQIRDYLRTWLANKLPASFATS